MGDGNLLAGVDGVAIDWHASAGDGGLVEIGSFEVDPGTGPRVGRFEDHGTISLPKHSNLMNNESIA